MATRKAATVEEYLQDLPEDRRAAVAAVRDAVRAHLPEGYEESLNWGMISYEVPLARYPTTYNGQPLAYAALAAQKNHYALYLNGLYLDAEATARFQEEYRATGKKLDMGKSCVRFRKLEDLPLELIGRTVAAMPPSDLIARYEASRAR
jgi:uncharacterized protein YdhG (YjbR/CyaY superfamily)